MSDRFRREQNELTPKQIELAKSIKDKAAELDDLIASALTDGDTGRTADPRCIASARTKVEEAVMWATKGVTA